MINPKKQKMWVGTQGATLHNTVGVKSPCLILSLPSFLCSSFPSLTIISQLCPSIFSLNLVPRFCPSIPEVWNKIEGQNWGTALKEEIKGQNNCGTTLKDRIEGTEMDRVEGQSLGIELRNRIVQQNWGAELIYGIEGDRIEGTDWRTVLKEEIKGQNNCRTMLKDRIEWTEIDRV